MTAGLMLKAGLWPLHFWLPPAHSSAPAPVSALLSALVVKGPYFILVRLWLEAFAPVVTPAAANTVGVLGACAIVWGALQALRQERLKQLVAYSTVAQLGYLFLLFPLALHQPARPLALTGALIFLAAHACAKAAMFLSVGNIMHAAGHDRIKELDGLTHVMPVSVFAFALAGLSLCGLPPSGGFVGKWQLMGAAMRHGHGVQWFWVAVRLGGGLLAAAYVMKVLNHAFTSPDRSAPHAHGSPAMEWTAFAMALLAVGLGLLSAWPAQLLLSSAGGRP